MRRDQDLSYLSLMKDGGNFWLKTYDVTLKNLEGPKFVCNIYQFLKTFFFIINKFSFTFSYLFYLLITERKSMKQNN